MLGNDCPVPSIIRRQQIRGHELEVGEWLGAELLEQIVGDRVATGNPGSAGREPPKSTVSGWIHLSSPLLGAYTDSSLRQQLKCLADSV